ncbi:MAG TPA: hypothetical protein VJZ71_19875 [Phycisphaerae bacterium]|nr:hypothetical protein [Phycisphaerae bacterium]
MTPLTLSSTLSAAGDTSSLAVLIRLRLRLLRNRMRQLADQSPLRLILILLFIGIIWIALYGVFDFVFTYLRRFEQQSIIAIPMVFHVFVMAMTFLLTFSGAVLAYAGLFGRAEPSFLLTTPSSPRHIVAIMYAEALFFSSWSLVLLGLPLMLAIGRVQGLDWNFYIIFIASFLAFVPIPGALGLIVALGVALWLPRLAKRTLFYASAVALGVLILWWGRLWSLSTGDSNQWLQGFLSEMQYLKAALLPSTWVTNVIRFAMEGKPADASFYLAVTLSTGLFMSWAAVTIVGSKLIPAYASAHSAQEKQRAPQGHLTQALTDLLFFYLPHRMRLLVLKDVRNFLRDPVQWSQLAILFGLLGLYLVYLPRTRPEGFSVQWQALICFLNCGAVTLILSTFTSRFVFPMISLEGRQMWLVGLWPLPRRSVMWAKFVYALTITALAALTVTLLSIRALHLPMALALVQAGSTLTACVGLCGLAVGLGARLPSYREASAGRIASGLGGTVNLIGSVGLVTISIGLVGAICYRMVQNEDLTRLDGPSIALFALVMLVGLATGTAAMRLGLRRFSREEF